MVRAARLLKNVGTVPRRVMQMYVRHVVQLHLVRLLMLVQHV